jgi:hypothetical protein
VQLQETVTAFLEQAAAHLHADVLAGHEVPFDLERRTGRMRADRRSGRSTLGASLYCYRPLTAAFIAERFAELRRLGSYAAAVAQLERCDALERYLLARGVETPRRRDRGADAVLLALLQDVFEEQTDFDPSWLAQRPERLERALDRLDGSSLPGAGEVTLVATLHGLAICSPEIVLTHGLSLARPDALQGPPEQALRAADGNHLLAIYRAADPASGAEGVAEGVEIMRELLRALRLFGDGRIALGTRAFARVGDGPWSTVALGSGGHPHGVLLITAEQEDELRAFCNLVSRRAPDASPIAWALRRFELGCDRACEYEGLSDHLLALRALLGSPSELALADPGSSRSAIGGAPDGLLAGRLAALCATPERRTELAGRTLEAIALERQAIAGVAVEHTGGLAVVRELSEHLRALLRDVICGHLQPQLELVADEILLAGEAQEGAPARAGSSAERDLSPGAEHRSDGQLALSEQQLGDDGDPAEVLRVAV